MVIVRNLTTGSAQGTIKDIASLTDLKSLPTSIRNLKMSVLFISKVQNGNYSMEVILKPPGSKFADRFTNCNNNIHNFQVVNEYIQFVDDASITVPSNGPFSISNLQFKYFATQSVRFAITVRCAVPPSKRVGVLEKCDGSPQSNFVRQQTATNGVAFVGLEESQYLAASIQPATHTVDKFTLLSGRAELLASMNVTLGLDVSMAYHDEDNKWVLLRSRTHYLDQAFESRPVTFSAGAGAMEGAMSNEEETVKAKVTNANDNKTRNPSQKDIVVSNDERPGSSTTSASSSPVVVALVTALSFVLIAMVGAMYVHRKLKQGANAKTDVYQPESHVTVNEEDEEEVRVAWGSVSV